jgi:hypothetical protein
MKNETLHFDYSALHDRMVDLGVTCVDLASALNTTPSTVKHRFLGIGHGGWTSAEMYRLCKILNILDEEIAHYFLRPLK